MDKRNQMHKNMTLREGNNWLLKKKDF